MNDSQCYESMSECLNSYQLHERIHKHMFDQIAKKSFDINSFKLACIDVNLYIQIQRKTTRNEQFHCKHTILQAHT